MAALKAAAATDTDAAKEALPTIQEAPTLAPGGVAASQTDVHSVGDSPPQTHLNGLDGK